MSGDDLRFAYFPDNHRWSHGMLLPLGGAPWGGGEIGEVHRVGLRLRDRVGDDRAWFAEWTRMADGAAAYRLRAAHYYHVGERFPAAQESGRAGRVSPRRRLLPRRGGPPAPAAHRTGRGAVRRDEPARALRARRGWRRPRARPRLLRRLRRDEGDPVLQGRTEHYATAALEYLAARPEIDPARIGAQWDYHAVWKERLERLARGETLSLSVPWEHLFLLVHGEGDAQIPLATAQKCFDAVGSPRKTFKVFTREEGGDQHCQVDNVSIGVACMWDWLEEVFRG